MTDQDKIYEAFGAVGKRLRKVEAKGGAGIPAGGVRAVDTIPPATPIGLGQTGASETTVSIQWEQTDDNVGVMGYRVYRDNVLIGTTTTTTFTDTGLLPGTTYNYTVVAYDNAGNLSNHSDPLQAMTSPAAPDTTPPTTPIGLTVTSLGTDHVSLSWQPSSDNVGVVFYTVFRNGAPIATPSTNSYNDPSVIPSTAYTYTVAAADAAGNHSGQSSSVIVTIPALPVTDTWYVATDGLATDDGSIDNPISLDHALNGGAGGQILAGHTVYIRGGTYNLSGTQIVDGLAGASGSRITIRAYPGERVFIRNNGGVTLYSTLELRDVEYVDFIGLECSMRNYTRTTEQPAGAGVYHITENQSYTQSNLRFLACYLHDSAGSAIGSFASSDAIEWNGCIFLYCGSNTDEDWTAWIQSAAGKTKTIKDCAFLHSAGDLLRLYSDDTAAVEGVTVEGSAFVRPGSLFADAGRGIFVAGVTTAPKDIVVDDNAFSGLGMTPDGNSAALQVGHIGTTSAPTNANTGPASNPDDGRFDAAGTFSNTSSTLIFGEASGPVFYSTFIRMPLAVPRGATITAASLTGFILSTRSSRSPSILINADKSSANPAAPTSKADADGRARTTASAIYAPGTVTLTSGTSLTITGLAAILQEIVNQASWVSGNHIILYLTDDGNSGPSSDIQWAGFGHVTYAAPVLAATYTLNNVGDAGIDGLTGTGNYLVGDRVDLGGDGYEDVTFTGNTGIYTGANGTGTEAAFPANTWLHTYPTTGQRVICRTLDWNNARALLLVYNWAGTASVTISAASLAGLNISAGDQYELRSLENFWSDVITGVFNGSSITINMSAASHTPATPAGTIPPPATVFPNLGAFHLIVLGGGSGEPPPPGDTAAPSVPTGLNATAVGTSRIDLTWNPSTDDTAVTGYNVYRGGVFLAAVSGTSYSNTGLAGGTTYSYTVAAYDAAGNVSAQSAADSATTDSPPPPPTGANWYVSPSGGSTSGTAGNRDNPFALGYALNGGAGGRIGPGDVVYLLNGTYSYSQQVVSLSGSSGNPIKFMPEPGAWVKFVGTNVDTQNLFFRQVHYVYFYDIEFTVTSSYSRTSQTSSSSPGCHIITSSGYTQRHLKFFGCIFHDHKGMGIKWWEYTLDGIEFNGCIVFYNGQNAQHDHNTYQHNVGDHQRLWKDCIFHNPSSYNVHCYDDGSRPINNFKFERCVLYRPVGLYSDSAKPSMLIGGNSSNSDNQVIGCFFYDTLSNSIPVLKMGYKVESDSGQRYRTDDFVITNNFSVGRPWWIECDASGYTLANNTIYTSGSHPSVTNSRLNAGSGNTVASIPTSGSAIFVRKYDWGENKRANIVIYNFGSASTVTVTNAMLAAQGIDIAAGDDFELRNSADPLNDIITGTYNGSSITIPMTGRSVAQPFGGISAPASTFPKFGCFILRVKE